MHVSISPFQIHPRPNLSRSPPSLNRTSPGASRSSSISSHVDCCPAPPLGKFGEPARVRGDWLLVLCLPLVFLWRPSGALELAKRGFFPPASSLLENPGK